MRKRHGPLPDLVIRMFDDGWQRWSFVQGMAHPTDQEGGDVRRILAVPARHVVAMPLWIDGTDAALAPDTAKLELEVRGLLPRVQGFAGVSLRLIPQEGRTLAVAAVFAPELPTECPEADVFDASPRLLALPRNAATLWREGEDIVAAVTRDDAVVYWETLDRVAGVEEMRVWLGLLLLRLRGEGVIEALPRVVSWIEGVPASRVAPEGCLADDAGDMKPAQASLDQARLDWRPVSVQLAAEQRVRRERIRQIALAVAAAYIVIAAVLVIFFGAMKWQAGRLAREAAELNAEVEKFQPIARDWGAIAPTVTPVTYPLEILGAVVGAMPPKPASGGGVKLILFNIDDGRVTVSGEADTFQMATDYYNTLAATEEMNGFNLQADTPQMKPNNSASFKITGTLPAP